MLDACLRLGVIMRISWKGLKICKASLILSYCQYAILSGISFYPFACCFSGFNSDFSPLSLQIFFAVYI